mmetsp:Transcript_101698/g.296515  ORF Transcript_101698/g.296515 Transcript_101698/m.296515 type:complete len:200 (-) Transcript_101698:911-1510(-)
MRRLCRQWPFMLPRTIPATEGFSLGHVAVPRFTEKVPHQLRGTARWMSCWSGAARPPWNRSTLRAPCRTPCSSIPSSARCPPRTTAPMPSWATAAATSPPSRQPRGRSSQRCGPDVALGLRGVPRRCGPAWRGRFGTAGQGRWCRSTTGAGGSGSACSRRTAVATATVRATMWPTGCTTSWDVPGSNGGIPGPCSTSVW